MLYIQSPVGTVTLQLDLMRRDMKEKAMKRDIAGKTKYQI